MTDKDLNIKNDDSSIEPELLGVELSEELKKTGSDLVEEVIQVQADDLNPIETTPKIDEKEFDLEIKRSETISAVPKKEFSMPEQSKQIEEIVDGYVPAPSLANSSH